LLRANHQLEQASQHRFADETKLQMEIQSLEQQLSSKTSQLARVEDELSQVS
jgi:hypothetical protein